MVGLDLARITGMEIRGNMVAGILRIILYCEMKILRTGKRGNLFYRN